ncbi:MAG: hypothetical protein ACWGIK_08395 [Achromobacter pulmonis]
MRSSPVIGQSSTRRVGRVMVAASLSLMVLGGCASGKPEPASPVPVAAAEPGSVIQLSRAVVGALPADAAVTLPAASQWRRVGAIAQGDVYRPLGAQFVVRAPRKTEAYLVASSGQWVGCYLPGERGYVELTRPVALPVGMRQ